MVNYAALKTELQTDPRGYGYAALTGDYTNTAVALNRVRDGSAGTVPATPTGAGGLASGVVTVKRIDINASEVLEAVDRADFVATPNALLCSYFESATQQQKLRLVAEDGSDTRILSNLKGCFTNSTPSRTRLNTIALRSGSRAEELFGTGTNIDVSDIERALVG